MISSAKTPEALEYLSTQFRSKTVRKTYLAVVKGRPNPPAGRIEKNIVRNAGNRKKFTWSDSAGKTARTNYRVLRQYEEAAFVVLKPETGRTHQLRVHMMSLGTPILGDPLYSRKSVPGVEALMLHAYMLEIKLPGSGDISVFRAPLPEDFKGALRLLSKRDA